MIVGYARVSTDGQTAGSAQQAALAAAGAEKTFSEKISGAVTDRKALARAIAALGAGDVLLVTRLDRLAQINQGPSQRPRCGRQGWRGVQVAGRYLGRHHHPTWAADADRAWWPCRVRTGVDQGQDRGRPQTSSSPRGEVWSEAQAQSPISAGKLWRGGRLVRP